MLQADDEHIRSEIFCPSLWKQRRNFIQDVLARFQIETVLDYGCGEGSVLSFLISPQNTTITKMAGIDIDLEVLQEAIERCMPLQTDFERQRKRPLEIDIYHGSIGVVDDRLKGYQAIVCSEVIEHLFPETFKPFLDVTLGIYQPEILLVTTPNGEYNVNFPNLKYGTSESMFRHDDHKFEWTREQFESWCRVGAKKHNYDIEFHGIGLLHGRYDELDNGHCTQACIFKRRSMYIKEAQQVHGTPHTHLSHIVFPYQQEEPLTQGKIRNELLYYIEALCRSEYYYAQDKKKPRFADNNDIQVDFEATIDWNNFNLSEYIPLEDQQQAIKVASPRFTQSPVHISLATFWEIPRVQEICADQTDLIHFLSLLDSKDFKLTETDLIVYKMYEIESDDTNSVSSFDSDER